VRILLIAAAVAAISASAFAGDYDASGTSSNGDYVNGEIESTPGSRDVEGYVVDPNSGEQIPIEGEWTGQGEVEVEDAYGNTYELETD
jgi:hypothetical protein